MADDQCDDGTEHDEAEQKPETIPVERIHEEVETAVEGQSATDIVEGLVSEPTARHYLQALVTTGFADPERVGPTTLSERDHEHQPMVRVREVREATARDELLGHLERMERDRREYVERNDVASPAGGHSSSRQEPQTSR